MSTHAVTDYIHKADISAQEGWCSRPPVSLNLLQHVQLRVQQVQRQFINDCALKSRQLQIYSKSEQIAKC